MNRQNHTKLDNPVWHSLNEEHARFSITYEELKCYQPAYCPFGGYQNNNQVQAGLDEYAKLTENFFIVGEKPGFSSSLVLKKELICLQMIIEKNIESEATENIVQLHDGYADELFDLITLVQPGYFGRQTRELGHYYGIFKAGKLVSVTGERMKMHDFTEVSAVVTHPAHSGRGYAKQLIAHTVNKIFSENKTPYLHVAETNSNAIELYKKLGFGTRRKISFWNFEKNRSGRI